MKKILTVIGARPQFIKAAPLSSAISQSVEFEEVLLHTGQHFDEKMSDVFFDELKIPKPKYRFNINSMGHGAMTGLMLTEIEKAIIEESPDLVLVYGDTNSTLAGALAAKKLNIKVAHVEAGLRSFNMRMPEEVNRILTDRISDFLFCPTQQAINNLENEGFNNFGARIVKTGDIMLDAMNMFGNLADQNIQSSVGLSPNAYVLATIHRAENTDNIDRLKSILAALEVINRTTRVILPLHPRTQKIIESGGINTSLTFMSPVGYLEMLTLLKNCKLVMTDSGGLQKEAYFMEKYCVTLRDQTEWTELVDNGINMLTGAKTDEIVAAYNFFSQKKFEAPKSIYGDGKTAQEILSALL